MGTKRLVPQGTAKDRLEKQSNEQIANPIESALEKGRLEHNKLYGNGPGGLANGQMPINSASRTIVPSANNDDRKTIYLNDGKKIEMGVPTDTTFIVVAEMMQAQGFELAKCQARMRIAQIMCYVRNVDGREQPGCLYNWGEVTGLLKELGELGARACQECYEIHWPDFGGTFWSDMKSDNGAN